MPPTFLPLVPVSPPTEDPWLRLKSLALDSLSSTHSSRAYGNALDAFQGWCVLNAADGFTKATVQRYRTARENGASRLLQSTSG